jgi:hypothetical protein
MTAVSLISMSVILAVWALNFLTVDDLLYYWRNMMEADTTRRMAVMTGHGLTID